MKWSSFLGPPHPILYLNKKVSNIGYLSIAQTNYNHFKYILNVISNLSLELSPSHTTPHFGFVLSIASDHFYITLCLLILHNFHSIENKTVKALIRTENIY